MNRAQRLAGAISCLAAAWSCSAKEDAPAVAFADCAIGEGKARCGALEVPENWDRPNGRKISLNIVVVPAEEPTGAAPLFDLAGGPGVAATNGAEFYLTFGAAHRADRDVVLVDQRGTGGSSPLRCAELEAASPLERMYPPDKVRACRDRLAADHDLARYTTLAAVRDMEAVREALGAGQIDLFGLSYGTKLAQAYIRAHPSRVRSAVLMSAATMDIRTPLYHARNAESALHLIFADCKADAACAAAYPAIDEDFAALVARFDEGPVRIATPDGDKNVQRGPFMETLRALLTSEAGQRLSPKLIHAAANDDFASFVKATTPATTGFIAEGMYLSVECPEGTALIDPSEIDAATAATFLGRYRIDEQRGACAEWPVAEVSPSFFEPVRSDVPVLILSGGRDHVTPKDYATRIAEGFSNSRVVLVEEMAHFPEAISNIDCLDRMIAAFYAHPDPPALDASCAATMQAPPFALPD